MGSGSVWITVNREPPVCDDCGQRSTACQVRGLIGATHDLHIDLAREMHPGDQACAACPEDLDNCRAER